MLYPAELRAQIAHRRINTGRDGRGRGIRTPDPLLPKQMRYQTAPCPEKPPPLGPRMHTCEVPERQFAEAAPATRRREPQFRRQVVVPSGLSSSDHPACCQLIAYPVGFLRSSWPGGPRALRDSAARFRIRSARAADRPRLPCQACAPCALRNRCRIDLQQPEDARRSLAVPRPASSAAMASCPLSSRRIDLACQPLQTTASASGVLKSSSIAASKRPRRLARRPARRRLDITQCRVDAGQARHPPARSVPANN